MCFCNPSSLSFHIKPVFHSCQLSSARKADEPVPALQVWPNLLRNRCPGPLCFSAPCLPAEAACAAKGGRTVDFLGSREGIKCFAHSRTLRTEVQEPACATTDQARNSCQCPPFHPSRHPAAATGSSPVSSWFHCCQEVAQRRVLLMLAWLQPCQSDGNLWGAHWGLGGGTCAKRSKLAARQEPCSRRRAGFPPCLCWSGQVGCHPQGKELCRSKWRNHVLKTAFRMSQQSRLPRRWSLPDGRADSFVGFFFPSAVEVDYSPSWSTSPALGSCFLSSILLDFSISEEFFQPALLLFCADLWEQGLEEKTEQANTSSLQACPTDAFPFQAGKATTAVFIRRTHWNLSPFRDTPFCFSPLFTTIR